MQHNCISPKTPLALAIILATLGASVNAADNEKVLEEIVVTSKKKAFSNQSITLAMQEQQNPITSVLASIDNLPGVNITEGDTFGFDDWSTTINLRGFQTSLSDQQVGITIDGLPNGESNYGGGAKANRFIDSANLQGIDVSQGTADIGSRSLEALGGTLNFRTRDPQETAGTGVQLSIGSHDALRYAASYDTGPLFSGSTRAFVSASHQEATDWVNNAAENDRDHFAAKLISEFGDTTLTGYLSYDDTHEDNYQRISLAEFQADATTDRLVRDWTGVPYIDQVHRRSWSTLRENTFGYLKLDTNLENGLKIQGSVYAHANEGRGDWVPPYLVNVANDSGDPESEVVSGNTILGAPINGLIYFVNADGNALSPREGCVSSLTFPYGGTNNAAFDPACYDNDAIAVQSYRHTHYEKDRLGATADVAYLMQFGDNTNEVRVGMWFEDQTRYESRDWHRITDTRVGPDFDETPYYIQYDREYPRDALNYYLEDNFSIGSLTLTAGVRKFSVDVERIDNFDANNRNRIDSDSDTLFSGGFRWDTPVSGLEVFGGYSENFSALKDLILERDAVDNAEIEPETSENVELGIRYEGDRLRGNLTYFNNTFENRLVFFDSQNAGNIPNFIIGTDGRYENVGGTETDGFEVSGTYLASDSLSLYSAFTFIDATYVGTGLGSAADAAQGIFPGNQVVNTPETSVVMSVDWAVEDYRAGISAKYVDDRYIDFANTLIAQSYTTADFYLGMKGSAFSESWTGVDLSLVVNNLFDESYLGGISGGNGAWIGAPRTAVFSVSANF